MKKKIALALLALALLVSAFSVRLNVSHFEDGSGTISVSYCSPLALCAEG